MTASKKGLPAAAPPSAPPATVPARRRTPLLPRLLLALAAACLSTLAFSSPVLAEGFEFEGAFGADGTGSGSFASGGSVAVDHEEEVVYVLDREADALFKFDLEGNPVDFGGSSPDLSGNELSGLLLGGAFTVGARQVAVDSQSHTIYLTGMATEPKSSDSKALLAFSSDGEPSKFTAGPGAGGNEIPAAYNLRGVAVDSAGNIYTSDFGTSLGEGHFTVYGPDGSVIVPSVAVDAPGNIAVDSNGVVYALRGFVRVGRYTPSQYPPTPATTYSAPGEHFDAEPSLSVAIEPGTDRVHIVEALNGGSGVDRVAAFDPDGTLADTYGGPGEAGQLGRPEGIAVTVADGARIAYVSHRPENGIPRVEIFREELCSECAPTIEGLALATVTGDSARLRARVNPQGAETTYWFEYGPEDCAVATCARAPTDGASVGSAYEDVSVDLRLTGLSPQSVYHYRLVAENEFGRTETLSKTFTTQGPGLGFALSDSRAWEMVSPSNKHGATLVSSNQTPVQASADGEGLAYASLGSIVPDSDGSLLPAPATVLSRRGEDGRWGTVDLTPPHTIAGELQADTEFNIFSPDLLAAELEPADPTPLSPEASEPAPYLWTEGSPPLFTPLVGPGNVSPGTKFGNGVRIEAASPDLTHVGLRSNAPLVEGAAVNAVYLWTAGKLEAVSELPQAKGGAVINATLGSGRGSVRHAISTDGSRIFWTPGNSYTVGGIELPALYLRDVEAGESVRLDVKLPAASGTGAERPAFNAASADGEVVFFTDSQRLTKDASTSGRDLYRCEVGPAGSGLGCTSLIDVSAPLKGSGESAQVLDQAPAASEDGSRIYFVARGVLDEEPNEEGQGARAGLPNLYLWEEGPGVRLVAPLAEEDHLVWGGMPTVPNKLGFALRISADASPDGRYLAFTSERSLTGYENSNESEEASTEAYLYDAEASADRLSCLSCNPTGASAVGALMPERVEFFPPDPGALWEERRVAATLPQATHTKVEGRALYRPRSVLGNGRVFFNSVDPLVPGDSNGNWDVYQYQPVGIGSCKTDTSTASAVRSGSGCVSLISSGASDGDAGFLDATPSGDDVFFVTKGRLSVLDKDKELDAYDARVNGIQAVLDPIRECIGEACQPSADPPEHPTPASETFRGAEIPLVCGKARRKVRRAGREICVPKKRRHRKKKGGKGGRAQR